MAVKGESPMDILPMLQDKRAANRGLGDGITREG